MTRRCVSSSFRNGRVLEGLDEIDWASLSHAYGAADDVPGQIRALASPDEETRNDALYELYGNIFHQGSRYEATPYAVPFLLELAASSETPGRADVIRLLVALAIGYDETWLPDGHPIREWRVQPGEPTAEVAAYDAVRNGVPLFRDLVHEPDEDLAAAAAYALAWFPEDADASVAALARRLDERAPSVVAATALIALGLLGAGEEHAERALGETSQVVRTAGAIALARVRGRAVPMRALDALADAAAGGASDERVPFHEGDLSGYAALAIAALPQDIAERAVDALRRGLEGVRFPRAATYANALLSVAFPDPFATPASFDAMTPLQQRVVRAIGDARQAWMPEENTYDANFAAIVQSYGFPGEPDEFRKFTRLAPWPKRRRRLWPFFGG